MIPCPLRDPTQMAALFAQFGAAPTTMYQEQSLNVAASYALFLEDHERDILAAGQYSITDILYGRFYWYTKFLCAYTGTYGAAGGMEQAQFKIIEAMDHKDIVDCETLEAIEQELGYST